MKVAIITDAFPPTVGGIESLAGEYVQKLAKSPSIQSVDVLAFEAEEEPAIDKTPILSVTRSSATGTVDRLQVGLSWLRRHGPFDVAHSLTIYPSGLIASLGSVLEITDRAVVSVYGTDALGVVSDPVHRRIRSGIFWIADSCVFISRSTREKVEAAYPTISDGHVIYPGPPAVREPGENVEPPELGTSFDILVVSRLVERKGIDDVINAVSSVSDIGLWIVGDGPYKQQLEKTAERVGIQDRVSFLGTVSDEALSAYYEQSDVFCLTSRHLETEGDVEGLGLVLLEAQQFGLPVIGTDSGGIPEAIADGRSGFIVQESAPEEIEQAVEQLKNDEGFYQSLSEGALKFVEEEFTWERCLQEHLEVYHGDDNGDYFSSR